MQNADVPQRNTISNEMKVDLNVFGALVLDWIRGHVHSTDIVAEDNCSTEQGSVELLEKLAEQLASATALATPRYSASALERETVC
jgi:hypothetical protein